MAVKSGELQEAAQQLANEIEAHDQEGLKALTDGPLREQFDAGEELYRHVDALWQKAKQDGFIPGPPERYTALAGLRDLAGQLMESAGLELANREH
ncbi:hypothetical protein [Kitasatospora herbaricolor]|uniref:hypothetical protein n=1 Tax=Kitasatospora herbaricolor TaxID=68217 RepID=UPI0036DE0385